MTDSLAERWDETNSRATESGWEVGDYTVQDGPGIIAENPSRAIRTSIFFHSPSCGPSIRAHFHLTVLVTSVFAGTDIEVVVCLSASRLDTFLSLLFFLFLRFSLLTSFASPLRPLFDLIRIPLPLSSTLLFLFPSTCDPRTILAKIARILLAHPPLGHQQIASWDFPFSLASPKHQNILFILTPGLSSALINPLSIHYQTRSPSDDNPTRPLSTRPLDDDIVNARIQSLCRWPLLLVHHPSRTGFVPIMRCRKRFKEDAC